VQAPGASELKAEMLGGFRVARPSFNASPVGASILGLILPAMVSLSLHAQPLRSQENAKSAELEQQYQRALALLSQGDSARAASLLETIVGAEPLHAGAWLDLAIARCDLGDAQAVKRLLSHIESSFRPDDAVLTVMQSLRQAPCEAKPHPGAPAVASVTDRTQRSFLRIGIGHSTNANFGLNSLIVPIGGAATSGSTVTDGTLTIPSLPLLLSETYAPRPAAFVQAEVGTSSSSALGSTYQIDWQISARARSWREHARSSELSALADPLVGQGYARLRPLTPGSSWLEWGLGWQQWVQSSARPQPTGLAQLSYMQRIGEGAWLAAADLEVAVQRLMLPASEPDSDARMGSSPLASAGFRMVYAAHHPWGRLYSQVQLAAVRDANRGSAGSAREGFSAGLRAGYELPLTALAATLHSFDLLLSQRQLKDQDFYAPALFPGVKRLNRQIQSSLIWQVQPRQSPWSLRLEWQYQRSDDRLPLFEFKTQTLLIQSQRRW